MVELHWEGSAINKATPSSFDPAREAYCEKHHEYGEKPLSATVKPSIQQIVALCNSLWVCWIYRPASAPTLSTKDNTKIFGLFLDPNLNHFKDIESVLSVMARAGVAMGLECCEVVGFCSGTSPQPQETPDPGEAGAGGHGRSQWAGRGALRLYCGGGARQLLEETEGGR